MRIIYQLPGQPVTVLVPAPGCGLTLQQIGQKDVPTGVPFWIVNAADIPAERGGRNAWELDPNALVEPSGTGDYAAFLSEQARLAEVARVEAEQAEQARLEAEQQEPESAE